MDTAHTSYQMKVDDFGFLLHLYYGGRVYGNMDYLLTCYDRGFSGNPSDVGNDRTYSMDVLPQEYPVMEIFETAPLSFATRMDLIVVIYATSDMRRKRKSMDCRDFRQSMLTPGKRRHWRFIWKIR